MEKYRKIIQAGWKNEIRSGRKVLVDFSSPNIAKETRNLLFYNARMSRVLQVGTATRPHLSLLMPFFNYYGIIKENCASSSLQPLILVLFVLIGSKRYSRLYNRPLSNTTYYSINDHMIYYKDIKEH